MTILFEQLNNYIVYSHFKEALQLLIYKLSRFKQIDS